MIDLLFLLILVWCVWLAVRRGFILSGLWLLSWVSGLVIAFGTYRWLGELLLKIFPKVGVWGLPLGFMLALLLSGMLIDLLVSALLKRLPERVQDSAANKYLGVLPGLVNGYIWAAFLSALLLLMPVNNPLSQRARQSRFARSLSANVGWLDGRLAPVFAVALNRGSQLNSGEERTTQLPFTDPDARPRPDLEWEMLRLMNAERAAHNMRPLTMDTAMTAVAHAHSRDMLTRGYFSHYTPEGTDPFDRMKKAHIIFLTGGENIAITQTLLMAHDGFMHSPDHRANILNPAFGRVGIGILDAGIYGLMITQSFRD